MPEGDTIYRAARTLGRALTGDRLVGFESVFPQINRIDEDEPLAGRTVESVASFGKHLLIRLSGNLTIRTHMRMNGSWHIYRRGERWRRSPRNARIVLETDRFVAVGFSIPVAEALASDRENRAKELRRLGDDLLSEGFDASRAIERLRRHPAKRVDDALLDQTIMAGVGNVYKSEVLFLAGIDPGRLIGSLDDGDLSQLVALSRDLLERNVALETDRPGQRRTTNRMNPSQGLWVYGRAGRPCRRCGTPIRRAFTGSNVRVTYWCPSCQESEDDPSRVRS
jgi:endonuclease-8